MNANGITAIAAVVNAVVVTVLAFFNYRYMLSASTQATATTKQAEAADKQAAAAFETIKLLKAQADDQARLRLTETLIDLQYMSYQVKRWIPICENQWGAMNGYDLILPANWPRIVHVTESNAPHVAEDLRIIETRVRNADSLISGQMTKNAPYRQADVFKAASVDLASASTPIQHVLQELDKQKRAILPPANGFLGR